MEPPISRKSVWFAESQVPGGSAWFVRRLDRAWFFGEAFLAGDDLSFSVFGE